MTVQIRKTYGPKTYDSARARAFDLLGKRWRGVMLGTLKTGPAGSSGLTRAVTRIGDSVLSGGFTELAGARIVERTVDVGPPVLVAYRLSASGLALLPAQGELAALARLNLAKAPTPTR